MLGIAAYWHERRLLDDFCDLLLLSKKSVEPCLRYGLVNFRLRTTRRNPAKNLTVDQDGKSALIRKIIREGKHVEVALLQGLSRVLRGTPIERRMPRLFLCPDNRIDRCSVSLLQKKQIAAFIDDANRDFYVLPLSFGLRPRNHRLDGCQVQILFRWQLSPGYRRHNPHHQNQQNEYTR